MAYSPKRPPEVPVLKEPPPPPPASQYGPGNPPPDEDSAAERQAAALERIATALEPTVVVESNDPISDGERTILFEDLRQMLRALYLPDNARPYSAHQVVQREILPAIRSIGSVNYERGRADGYRAGVLAYPEGGVPPYVVHLVRAYLSGEPLDFEGTEVPSQIQRLLEEKLS